MFLLSYNQARYVALRPPHAQDNDTEDPESISVEKKTNITKRPSTFVITILSLFFFATGFLCGEFIQDKGLISKLNQAQNSRCQAPSIRREWRSLSSDEKTDYISAVRCLLSKPSKVTAGTSLYHDFPRLHSVVGGDCKSQPTPSVLVSGCCDAHCEVKVQPIPLPQSLSWQTSAIC